MKWESKPLDHIFDVARGGSPRPIQKYLTSDPKGYNWIMIGDVSNGSKYICKTKNKIIAEGLHKTRQVKIGDLLLTNSMSFGRPYILKISGCIHDGWLVLSPKRDGIFPDFYFYLLGSNIVKQELIKRASGAVVKNLNTSIVKNIKIPLPPLSEQKRIARILDAADALRAKRRESLTLLDNLTQSIFLDMFGDPVTNPMGWEIVSISETVDGKFGIKAGPFGSALKKEDYGDSGFRVYGQEQVIAGRFDIGDYYIDKTKFKKLSSCAVKSGDILVSLVGSYGKVLIVPDGIEPGIINPRLLKITPRHEMVTSLYLATLIQNDSTQRKLEGLSHGGTMGILNAGLLKQLTVPIPPLHLQQRFASIVESIEKQKERLKNQLSHMDTLFSSLQQRAFNGEL